MSAFSHEPVLLNACMQGLNVRTDGLYVDGTLGGGGHAREILRLGGKVIGIDRDGAAIEAATERLASFGGNFRAFRGNYVQMREILSSAGIEKVDGILLDLGVSSYQLDTPERGFSFHNDAPLDMRMDLSQNLTAAVVLNTYSEDELRKIFYLYGEEKWSARIAKFVIERRPLATTGDLVRVIDAAVPKAARAKEGRHPARRCFQAVRVEVNGELADLNDALHNAMDCLKPGGRLAVITFHSLEDRRVKETMRRMANPCDCPPGLPICVCGKTPVAKAVTRKPIPPSADEIERNPRAHSAKLRVAERL